MPIAKLPADAYADDEEQENSEIIYSLDTKGGETKPRLWTHFKKPKKGKKKYSKKSEN